MKSLEIAQKQVPVSDLQVIELAQRREHECARERGRERGRECERAHTILVFSSFISVTRNQVKEEGEKQNVLFYHQAYAISIALIIN